ncbi:HesA/MoeB/ThiF family protein [Kosmotoga pacifica]|uniref:HesA/MoeB/ThiF family protein n=1 Tax=Kosmotoga pacifica TaxID=1330330 RepID=UPI00069BB33C|nr:ThiF family adenylyltransferase [Kosmotoga pacifica]
MEDKLIKAYFERQLLIKGIDIELHKNISQLTLSCPRTRVESEIVQLLFRAGFVSLSSCYDSKDLAIFRAVMPFMQVSKEPDIIFQTSKKEISIEYSNKIWVNIPEGLDLIFAPLVAALVFLSVMKKENISFAPENIQLPLNFESVPPDGKVMIVGAGGLGSPVIEFLLRNGLENLIVVEPDILSVSNIHRQTLYTSEEIGMKKSDALRKKLSTRNNVSLKTYSERFDSEMLKAETPDLVVACVDNYATRYAINDACYKEGIPFIDAGVEGFSGYIMPHRQRDACYRCFIGDDRTDKKGPKPILPFTSYFAGMLEAAYASNILRCPDKPMKGFWFDLKNLTFTGFEVEKRRGCSVCDRF